MDKDFKYCYTCNSNNTVKFVLFSKNNVYGIFYCTTPNGRFAIVKTKEDADGEKLVHEYKLVEILDTKEYCLDYFITNIDKEDRVVTHEKNFRPFSSITDIKKHIVSYIL